jgi:hypothetical protein
MMVCLLPSFLPSFLHALLTGIPLRQTDSLQEKTARAALFTAITRHMGKDTILIVDAMNYIKGFRYQMYCKAREAGVRVATVGNRFQHSRQHTRAY